MKDSLRSRTPVLGVLDLLLASVVTVCKEYIDILLGPPTASSMHVYRHT